MFIPIGTVEKTAPLRKIRDVTLDYLGRHVEDLKEIEEQDKHSMNKKALRGLIEEIDEAYDTAEFFDTETFSKESQEEKKPF